MNLNRLPPTRKDPNNYATTQAIADLRAAVRCETAWSHTVDGAIAQFGDGSGVLISGVYRDHFPETVKATLRILRNDGNSAIDDARAAWRRAGRTRATFLQARQVVSAEFAAKYAVRF